MGRCWLLFHKWKLSRPLTLEDAFPFYGEPYENPTRVCMKCGKRQRWLPGYGGSEFGCWLPERTQAEIDVLDGGGRDGS